MTGLVLIDVDGTLYGADGVPDCAWSAAELARAAGIRLAVCTGRPGRGFALEYARRLEPRGWHIFESGAVVMGSSGPERVCALPQGAYQHLLELSRRHGLPFEVYTAEGGFYRESAHPDLLAHEQMLGFPAEVRDLEGVPGPIVRVQYVVKLDGGWEALRPRVQEVAGVELHEATSPGMPGVGFASVTAQGVSKVSAARWVAERYGLTLEHAAMIGDGENDLELIRSAGLGIAMGNAPASVKAVARYVVPRVEECGLAEALQRVMSENRAGASSLRRGRD
ncbi:MULTISPECIES: HAD family hydrolase [unclassified Meiothermus]|uniref:HAD family hydrolase n=1 Tax=unclassified Meiothermus TaxID=370471 RepID=UPI000D7C7453|nr:MULTISPECIES: HAD family hydrolase [unclassified Meiothermus]PZA06917.1 haloacid dehalogenase [Meiothermus sp. Pnk-1]RYM38312.1 HAD family phosphatase [Meiothermus sp. PNK-Is4]